MLDWLFVTIAPTSMTSSYIRNGQEQRRWQKIETTTEDRPLFWEKNGRGYYRFTSQNIPCFSITFSRILLSRLIIIQNFCIMFWYVYVLRHLLELPNRLLHTWHRSDRYLPNQRIQKWRCGLLQIITLLSYLRSQEFSSLWLLYMQSL